MKALHSLFLLAAAAPGALLAADYKFEAPQKVMGGDKAIEVEAPGYAAPGLYDVTGDGVPDLLVGQFKEGKIGLYKGSRGEDGKLTFGAHEWLMADGEIAKIPGVW